MADIALRESPPDWVSDLPRDYSDGDGTVVKEVGVVQDIENGSTYWKAFQLIEMDHSEEVRTGYYTKRGGWQNKPLMLPPPIMDDLTTYAKGKIW